MTRETLKHSPAFVIIIRAIHTRGAEQVEAIEILRMRGLWLSADQQVATGLAPADFETAYQWKPEYAGAFDA